MRAGTADVRLAASWQRDRGRCRFEGLRGRCAEAGFLEYHHVVPFAEGGETSANNLELRCRAHNQYEADLWCDALQAPRGSCENGICPPPREDHHLAASCRQ